MDDKLFDMTCEYILNKVNLSSGIGTLMEKTIHSVFKHYYEPNCKYHEVKINNFIADIVKDNIITEIQTTNFNKLRKKIDSYLPDYKLVIVYPITVTNYIHWIDPDTGQISKGRKSPKPASVYDVFTELYKIKFHLNKDNLSFKIPLISSYEYRYLDGYGKDRKKGATKCDKIPSKLLDEISLNSLQDYLHFIPKTLLDVNFTSKDFAKAASISLKLSQLTLNILNYIGLIDKIGKSGRLNLYKTILT